MLVLHVCKCVCHVYHVYACMLMPFVCMYVYHVYRYMYMYAHIHILYVCINVSCVHMYAHVLCVNVYQVHICSSMYVVDHMCLCMLASYVCVLCICVSCVCFCYMCMYDVCSSCMYVCAYVCIYSCSVCMYMSCMYACLYYVHKCAIHVCIICVYVHPCWLYVCTCVFICSCWVCMCVSWVQHACTICIVCSTCMWHMCMYAHAFCVCAVCFWAPLLKPPFLITCLWFGNDKPSQCFPYWHLPIHTATVALTAGTCVRAPGRAHSPLTLLPWLETEPDPDRCLYSCWAFGWLTNPQTFSCSACRCPQRSRFSDLWLELPWLPQSFPLIWIPWESGLSVSHGHCLQEISPQTQWEQNEKIISPSTMGGLSFREDWEGHMRDFCLGNSIRHLEKKSRFSIYLHPGLQ